MPVHFSIDIHSIWTDGLQMQDLVVSILGICGLLLYCIVWFACVFLNAFLCLCFVVDTASNVNMAAPMRRRPLTFKTKKIYFVSLMKLYLKLYLK